MNAITSAASARSSSSRARFAGSPHPGNQLLAHLPDAARQQLQPHLHRVALKTGHEIFHAHAMLREAYFPESGVISLLARSASGETLDVGLVGRDGMAGVALIPGVSIMPYDAVVQIGGSALRVAADALRTIVQQTGAVHQMLGRFAYAVFANGVQTAVCNNFHSIEQRCVRWLLMLHDLGDGDEFPLTQNLLALMLGVRRPSVTLTALALQRAGLVDYHRGHITILDRAGLESASCECYRLMRQEQLRLLGY